MQVVFILSLSFITTVLLIYTFYSVIAGNRILIARRLETIGKGKNSDIVEEELAKPFLSRIIQPTIKKVSMFMMKVTPKEIISNYEIKIIAAGTPMNYSVNVWLTLQIFIIVLVPALSIILGLASGVAAERIMMIAVLEILFGILGPSLILTSKIKQRQKDILKALPDILDLLTVSVEAGLGFDAALSKVVEKMTGVLAKEFDKVLQEIKMGKPRKDALRNMGDRIAVVDVTTFIASVIQADQLGVSVGNVLRVQSDQVRLRRRQRAQEKAMKAPIKMLLPMVFFIFPTIFTVLLGPVVIRLMEAFAK